MIFSFALLEASPLVDGEFLVRHASDHINSILAVIYSDHKRTNIYKMAVFNLILKTVFIR